MPEFTNLGHIDRALTNISVAYMQGANAFIADQVFPIIKVQKRSDVYFKYSKSDSFRNEVRERGRGAESHGMEWNIELEEPYFCRKYALHYDISPEEKVNYDQPINVDKDTAEILTAKMLLKREIDFHNKFFKTGIWSKDITGVSGTPGTNQVKKWSDPASDPVGDMANIMLAQAGATGYRPNFAIMSPDVFYALKNHEAVLDRIKYTQKGIVTVDLIASLFELDKIFIPWGVVNGGPTTPKYDETMDATDFIYKGQMLVGYRTLTPSIKSPTAGYIFAWTGLEGASAYGSRMVRIKMDHLGLGTERLECEMAYDMKLVCADMGTFLTDLV